MTSHLDLFENLRVPHVNVAGALALARELLVRMPADARPVVLRAARRMRDAAVDLHYAWRRSTPAALRTDPRPVDQELDAAWVAVHERLHAYTGLGVDGGTRAAHAQELLDLLFPDGLGFLDEPYAQQWAESERRLDAVRDLGHHATLVELCGAEFVAALERAQERYASALGMGAGDDATLPAPATLGPLRALRAAIGHYAIQVVAAVDPERAPALTSATVALQPLLAHRNRAWALAPEAEPSTPEPELPEVPPYEDLSDLLD